MEQLIGKTLNRYTILTLLGKGGIGAVYRARDTVLQRDVAIKVLSPEYAGRPNFQERFLQEARAAARLDHPSIVRLHDFGRASLRGEAEEAAPAEDRSFLYIVMEYIPGDDLRKMLNDLRASRQWVILPEAVQIAQQIAEALEYAHNQGVLHLDLKPSNLMLRPSANDPDRKSSLPYRVVITDLGLAQLAGSDVTLAQGGSMGTPAYMSPEQALGQKTDARSDVYSLGVLLYELAVGRVPFPARTIEEAVRYHTSQQPPSPRSIRPDLPVALERAILRALQKDPAQRYQSAGQLAAALEEILPAIREVAFRPDEDTQTISLITQYENTVADEPLSPDPRGTETQTAPRIQDYVEIVLPDQTVRAVPMQPGGLTIGRDADNDIILDNAKISRHHARIQADGGVYWVSDLNSKNGTLVGGRRLIPGEPVRWTPDQALQIGDFRLRLRQSTESIPTTGYKVYPASDAETAAFVNPLPPASGERRIGLFMETVQLSVTPGNSVTASMVLINQGAVTDQYRITIAGIPANWIPNPPPVLRLPSGAQQEIEVTIHPPLSPQTRPGRYPLTVRAASQEDRTRMAEVEAILTVGVYSQFTSEMRPRQIWSDAALHVSVQNGGNARQSYTITAADRADELAFDPPAAQVALGEGETATVDFTAAPRRPRVFGGTRSHPFAVQVATPGGEVQTHNGEVFTNGLIPLWVLPVLLLVCLCATALAAYGYIDILQGPARARQTAQAATQAVFLTQTAIMAGNLDATLTAIAATPSVTPLTPIPDTDTPTPTFTDTQVPPDTSTPTLTDTPLVIVITVTSPPDTATPTLTEVPPSATLTQTTPPEVTATPLGGSRLVIFATNRDGNYEIYAMLNDGTRQTRVTNNGADDRDPSLSSSGLRTVFVSNRDGNDEIYAMNVDGGDQTRLTNNDAADTKPAWSNDGNRIVFVSDRDGNKEIYIMNPDGTGQTRLTNNDADDDNPSFSPDGTRIVFERAVGEARHIYIMDAAGGNAVALVENNATNLTPVFSPDGGRIAYVSNAAGGNEIYVMNANGSGQSQLTNLALNAFNPHWSNDGNHFVFESRLNDSGEIYRIDASGGNPTNLTNNTVDDSSPTW